MRVMIAFTILLCLLSGCAATRPVDAKYLPLKTMSERPWLDFILEDKTNLITTVGDTIYVQSLAHWDKKKLERPVYYDAVMLHEMTHSYRQNEMGLALWLSKYATSADFRWKEEQIGWFVTLRHFKKSGYLVSFSSTARNLAGYTPKMVDYDVAFQWVMDVMGDRWAPDIDEPMPPSLR